MKGMGGIELIKEIKKGFPWIKILVLTTFYDDKNITNAIAGRYDRKGEGNMYTAC